MEKGAIQSRTTPSSFVIIKMIVLIDRTVNVDAKLIFLLDVWMIIPVDYPVDIKLRQSYAQTNWLRLQ